MICVPYTHAHYIRGGESLHSMVFSPVFERKAPSDGHAVGGWRYLRELGVAGLVCVRVAELIRSEDGALRTLMREK